MVFGYFECLLASQDLAKVSFERSRLLSFNDMMVNDEHEAAILEGFVEETMDVFELLRRAIESGNCNEQVLLDVFNDLSRSSSIVFHFRVNILSSIAARCRMAS
jgi:hypothetical protein